MIKRNLLVLLTIFIAGTASVFAGEVIPGLDESAIGGISQKGLFMVSNTANSVHTLHLLPDVSKPYGWKLEDTWGANGVVKQSPFLDIGTNFDIDTKKMIFVGLNGKLLHSSFSSGFRINYEFTDLASTDLISNLVGLTNSNSLGYQCWTETDSEGNVLCAGILNSAGFFKVSKYAVDNRSNNINILSLVKVNGFKQGGTIDKINYKEYGILEQRNGANTTNITKLVVYKPADNRYISAGQLNAYPIRLSLFQFNGAGFIQTDTQNIAFFGNDVLGLEQISVDKYGNTVISETLNGNVNGYLTAFPKESLHTKSVSEDGVLITKKYITVVLPNGTLADMDYTNARTINREETYPLLTAANKGIEVETNVANTIKEINLLSVVNTIGNGLISNESARFMFARPFAVLNPQFKSVINSDGITVNYLESFDIRNLDADPNLSLIYDTNKIKLASQAGVVYGAFRKDYNNIGRIGYFKVAPIWYKLGQYVDNGRIITAKLDIKDADGNIITVKKEIYSPIYANQTSIILPNGFKGFVQNISNNYIISHGAFGKYIPSGSLEDKTLVLNDITTNSSVQNTITDNINYFVNLANQKLIRYDESDVRYINKEVTTLIPKSLSGVSLTYITPTNTRGGNLLIASLSGDNLYLDEYDPLNETLLTGWTQLTSGSDTLNFFKTDGDTTILIDADNLLWKKTN